MSPTDEPHADEVEEIMELVIRYAYLYDQSRYDEASELFTETGKLDTGELGNGTHTGRGEIRALMQSGAGPGSIHCMVNHVVDQIAGMDAEGSVYSVSETLTTDGAVLGRTVLITDQYALTSDGWRFKRRGVSRVLASSSDEEHR